MFLCANIHMIMRLFLYVELNNVIISHCELCLMDHGEYHYDHDA